MSDPFAAQRSTRRDEVLERVRGAGDAWHFPDRLAVLREVAWHADADGTGARPSARTIAKHTGLSVNRITPILEQLSAAGLIVKTGVYRGSRVYALAPTATLSGDSGTAGSGSAIASPPSPHAVTDAPADCHSTVTRLSPYAVTNQDQDQVGDLCSPVVARNVAEDFNDTSGEENGNGGVDDDDELAVAEHVRGVLQRGIDGLTTEEPCKAPTRAAVLKALRVHPVDAFTAWTVAVEVRSIAQSQDRAPNIAALYARKLAERVRISDPTRGRL